MPDDPMPDDPMPDDSKSLQLAKPRRRWLRFFFLALGPLILLSVGAYMYATGGRYVTTENAYVKTNKIAVSTDISGRVAEILVVENDRVNPDQVLFRVHAAPFRIALAQAEAKLGIVAQEIEALRTQYRQELVELEMAKDDVAFFEREYQRQQRLSNKGVVSKATHDEARHQMQSAQQRITATHEELTRALAQLGGDPTLATEKHPRYRQALAELDQALLDLEYTVVKAPSAGVISNLQLEVGEYVEAGKPVFSLVSAAEPWVTANLKETDLTHIREGQLATVRADAYPDHQWQAVIASISPATGAEFSLLPPQNASGNWVKVVQRVPVRLTLVESSVSGPPLRAGMSVHVSIDTEHDRPLPPFVQSALAWVHANLPPTNQQN